MLHLVFFDVAALKSILVGFVATRHNTNVHNHNFIILFGEGKKGWALYVAYEVIPMSSSPSPSPSLLYETL